MQNPSERLFVCWLTCALFVFSIRTPSLSPWCASLCPLAQRPSLGEWRAGGRAVSGRAMARRDAEACSRRRRGL